MRLKTMFLAACLLLMTGIAQAQFNHVIWTFDTFTNNCDGSGGMLEDGMQVVTFYWDQDNDGPDDTDPIAPDATQAIYALNGNDYLGVPGAFYADPAFTYSAFTPNPSRFYIRIVGATAEWTSVVFSIASGYSERDLSDSTWTCETIVNDCPTPASLTNLTATTNLCTGVTLNWDLFPDNDRINTFRVLRNGVRIATIPHTNTTYTDLDAPVGESQYTLIVARDCGPGDTATSSTIANGSRQPSPPAVADTSFQVTTLSTECGAIIVRWRTPSSIANLDSFGVFRDGFAVHRVFRGAVNTVIRDTLRNEPAGSHNYSVAGWNVGCGYGTPTQSISASAPQPPATPTGLTASNGLCTVNLSWNAVAGANNYRVYRDNVLITTINAPNTTHSDGLVAPGVSANYQVSAFITANPTPCQEGARTGNVVGSRIGAPNAPSNVQATDSTSCTTITVTWTDASSDETGFTVRRGGVDIATVGAGVQVYNDNTGLTPGTTYSYTVVATNTCGTSTVPTANNGTLKQAPPQVTGVAATDDRSDFVRVTWTNTIRETSYNIIRDGGTIASGINADSSGYNDLTAAANVTYQYAVQAVGECGNGAVSTTDAGTRVVTVTPATNVVASDTICTFVRVTWTDSPDETSYEVLRDNVVISGILPAGTLLFNDNTATRPNVYSYVVRANGTGGSANSTPDNGQLAPLPAVPVIVVDSVTCNSAYVTYTRPTDADSTIFFLDGTQAAFATGTAGQIPIALADDNTYALTAVGGNECGRGTASAPINVQRDQVPATITDYSAFSNDCQTVQLGWTPTAGADSVRIFKNAAPYRAFPASVTSFADTVGNGPQDVQYWFVAFNVCGSSAASQAFMVNVQQSPTAPTGVILARQCGSVNISWNAASGDVDGYEVYRDGVLIATLPNTQLNEVHSPPDNLDHSYTVVATSTTCPDSPPSVAAVGRPLDEPSVPGSVTMQTAACDEVTFCWTASTGDFDFYVIYIDGDSVASVPSGTLCYTYVGTPGSHEAQVAAYSAQCGVGLLTNPINAVIYGQPTAPANFNATDDRCDGVTLTWDAQPDFSGFTGYTILRGATEIFSGSSLNDTRIYHDAAAPLGASEYSIVATSDVLECGDSSPSLTSGTVLPEPFPPANVAATDTSCLDVRVTWSASTGTFDGYIVYRGGVALDTVAAPTTEYTDNTISPNTTAAYTVRAWDDVCGASGESTADNGTRLQGPDAPTGVLASNTSCDEIEVTWNTAPGDVTEYRIYRDGVFAGSVVPPTTSFTDEPVAGVYTYTVTAFSVNCGETAPSVGEQGERLPQMGQVTGVVASVDSCQGIYLSWNAYPGATEYHIYRNDIVGDWWGSVIGSLTTTHDLSVPEGGSFTYTVTAVNTCNEGPESAPAIGTRASTPSQVTGLTATTTLVSQVCLTWTDVTGELSYIIYRDGAPIDTVAANTTEVCDLTATPGVTYTYTVAATNVCGTGTASTGAQGMAVFSLGQVTGVVATTTDCAQICLSWTDIANETGYRIFRDGVELTTVAADVVSFCDLTVVAGTCHDYYVVGFNVGGNGPASATVNGCRRTIPTVVTGLAASTTNCTVVVLTWTDATNEDGYDVYRDGGLVVQNLPAGTVTYSDNTAAPGVVYSYTVVARNACGSAAASAAAQGVVAQTPPAVEGLVASTDVCNQIGLNWTDQLSETGYSVYRDGNVLTPIATLPANTVIYVDNNITGVHTYNVRAVNNCGNGALGNAVTGEGYTVPGTPTNVAASEDCGDVTVTWNAPATAPITEHRIFRDGVQIGAVLFPTATYLDENVPAGSHSYRVVAANQCGVGNQSAQSNSVTVIPALVQVTGFSASASPCFCINLAWSNVINESGYYIYCDGVIVDTLGPNVTSAEYCPADTANCLVQVAAFNDCEIGPLSTAISVTPNTYPVAVANFNASENLCDRVRLTWLPYSDPGVNFFRIERNNVGIATVPSSATQYDHVGIWPQSTYQIRALRVCAAGDTISMISADQGRTAPTPVAPSQMAASDDGCGIVTVTFTFNNIDGQDSVIISRNGIRLADGAFGPSQIGVQRSYVDTNPLTQPATYEVCAKSNICGEGGCTEDVGQAAPTAGTVTNLEASHDRCTSILLEWTGTQFALNYVVRKNGNVLATVPQGTTTYTDQPLTPGTVANYTVAATNACGSGPQTPSVSGSTVPLPAVPTGVNASDGLCNVVIVTWNELGNVTGYQVWRNGALLAETPEGLEVYNDTDVLPGVSYNYQVRGVNQCGNGNLSTQTQGFSAQVIATVTNLVASINLDDRVHLSWNNVPQEIGYEILRGFPAEVIATVGADVTSYEDFSAAPGEEYEYRVRAYNGCGVGNASNVAYGYRVAVDPIPFGVITLTEELFGCMSAVPADMDNDGDMDVVAAGMFADKIVWFENNGSWGYTQHDLVTDWDGARSVEVLDIDDDGDKDIAAVAQFADQLIWLRHNANGTYSQFVIASNYDGARDVKIVDLDGDGDKDLVTAACDANDISWWRNNGSETFTRFVVSNNFVGARSIELADIGGDGDLDILGAAYEGGELAWWSNNGSEVFTKNLLMDEAFGASYINAARLNGDNVLDIYFCVAQEPLVAWWDGATMELHYVTSLVPFPREMDAVDMDADNSRDLLLAANENQEISWWRNTDNRFYRNVITNTLWQASVVHGGDFDNDGDTDVLGAGEGTIKIWLSALSDDVSGTELAPIPGDDDGTIDPQFGQPIVPLNYELSSNYPNPFNPTTQIRFGLPEANFVRLTVYDVTGREVAQLIEGEVGAGYHVVTFDGANLASGVYLYRLEAGDFIASRKMVLMK